MANYGEKGWIKLWRSEMVNNPFYQNGQKSFDQWHAWMDLRLMADSDGTVKTSLEALKNRWFWSSRMKVSRFLVTLNETGFVTVTSTQNKGTLIRINTGKIKKNDRKEKDQNETANETDSVIEEFTSKEVGRASLGVSPPNRREEERVCGVSDEEYRQLIEEDDDDEYV